MTICILVLFVLILIPVDAIGVYTPAIIINVINFVTTSNQTRCYKTSAEEEKW